MKYKAGLLLLLVFCLFLYGCQKAETPGSDVPEDSPSSSAEPSQNGGQASDLPKKKITKEALIESIENRLDGNYAGLRALEQKIKNGITVSSGTDLVDMLTETEAENEILEGYLEDLEREDVNIGAMWNEYWYEIVGRAPPAEYETYEEAG